MGTVRIVDPVRPLIALATAAHPVAAQHVDSAPPRVHVAGAVTVTNRGISLIPSFTLGRPISDRYFVQVAPQLYCLRTDDRDGFYFNSALTLADRRLSISAMLNQALRTRIVADRFLWNVSLTYSLR